MSFDDIFDQINDIIDNPIEDREDQKTQYVAFVLDMSGSMGVIKQVAINSYNEQLQELKKQTDIKTKVITTVFNSSPVNMDGIDVVPLEDVEELTEDTYYPSGMTALYDAIGFTINKVVQEYKDDKTDTAVLFVVITDGQENNSLEFHQANVKQMTEDLEKTKRWTFTYLGANVNPLETAVGAMGYSFNNTLSWQSDVGGTRKMSDELNLGINAYYSARRVGETMTSNFFNDKTDDEDDSQRPKTTTDGLTKLD
jgi:uncharacterized protein YegL